jgi:undecaprenyldiphospho-muramoylpentapeptide beta-N-acetylglucosaminyltransferase
MSKKVLIATGGTGGHIYPALGLADELSTLMVNCSIHIAGHELKKSPFLSEVPYTLHSISSSKLYLKNPFKLLGSFFKISKGIRQSLRLINDLKPDTVVGFGSFHTFPLLVAAIIKKVPIILHEGNAIPGRVNKLLSRYCHFTAVQFPEAIQHLRGEKKEALLPLRKRLTTVTLSQEEARKSLNLYPDRFTILIFGGSLGASFLNKLMEKTAPLLTDTFSPLQIIHITGNHPEQTSQVREAYKKAGIASFVAPYHFDMGTLWKSADLSISRSGASTIREMIAFEVPAILIPYPHATDNHQAKNGLFISSKIGGGFMMLQKEASEEKLLSILEKLFSHKMATYRAMKQALKSYKKRVEKQSFAELIKLAVQK